MSWDVHFQRFPTGITSIEEIPENFLPEPLCTRSEFESLVKKLFPNIDAEDKSWMILEGDTYSIEFNSGQEDPVEAFMLHVRGDEKALEPIRQICSATGWKALDCSTSEFIDFESNPDAGFSQWRQYRDQVMGESLRKTGKKWWEFWK